MIRTLTICWTFLTRERSLRRGVRAAPANRARKRRRQRGVAIITVLIALSLTLVLTNQFSTTTNVDLIAAANYRDQVRAHFLARSALNLSEFVIRLQRMLDAAGPEVKQFIGDAQVTEFANQLMLAFCGSPEEVKSAVGNAASLSKGLGADVGTCGVVGTITTDDDKINVNCANDRTFAPRTKFALEALVAFSAYDTVFEDADAENWRRDRALQVSALVDYVDRDTTRGVLEPNNKSGAVEDYGYESLKDHYKQKNTYVDSIGELKLVRGVDDRFWTLFGSSLTVYGGCKVNMAALTNVQLIAGILYAFAKNPNDPVVQDPQKLFALAGLVAKAKQFGIKFTKPEAFAEFVKDPAAAVGTVAGKTSMAGTQASAAISSGLLLPGGQKLGLELVATSELNNYLSFGGRRTFRVEAWGEVDRKSTEFPPIRSTITGVWDVLVSNQNARKAPGSTSRIKDRGAWVFLRED